MPNRILSALLISILTFSGCQRQNIAPRTEREPSPTVDYFIFGHLGSFCMNCDAVYKIQNGKLYGANHQIIFNPDSAQLKLLPNSSYEIVSGLPSEIPSPLLTESSTSIGSYFPDVGHYYIEVSRNHVVHHWYVEAGAPEYLSNFLNDVNEALSKLD